MLLKENLKAGDEFEIQICNFGEVPAETVDGQKIVQKFTKEALETLVANYDGKPIRVDFDHQSEVSDNTIAAGWVNKIWVNETGLAGNMTVSSSGSESLNGLDYRYLSPAFVLNEDGTPYLLTSIALTNRPRMKDLPEVWNSEEAKDEVIEVNNNTEDLNMEKIKDILGLPAEATEEDIINSVQEMVNKLKEIADAEIAKEAEEAVNECGVDEDKKEEVVNFYKQNPALVKSVLNAMKKEPVKQVVNSEEAVKPELTDEEKLMKEYNSLKGGQEKVDFLLKHPGIKL